MLGFYQIITLSGSALILEKEALKEVTDRTASPRAPRPARSRQNLTGLGGTVIANRNNSK